MLGAAQAFRLTRRIEHGPGTIGPAKLPLRRFETRPQRARRNRDQPAFALDHHASRFAQRRRDQRDAGMAIAFGYGADPFRPRPGLAETASGQDQPGQPFAIRR
jgi:hypothetical protein